MTALALAAAVWLLMSWQGGLHAWQLLLAALGVGILALQHRELFPGFRGLGGVEKALWILLAAALLGILVSLQPQATLNEAAGLALALTAASLLRRQARPLAPLLVPLFLATGALLAAFFGSYQYTVQPWIFGNHWSNPIPTAELVAPNVNLLCSGLIVPSMLLGAAWAASDRSWMARGLAATTVVAGCFALVFGGSRGAYVALAVGLAWLAMRWRAPRRRILVVATLALALLGALTLWAPFSRISQRVKEQAGSQTKDPNYFRRAEFWKDTLRLSLRRPLMGYGLGSFAEAAYALDLPTPLTVRAPIARYRMALEHAHNDWLELAAEAGWPVALGLALCAALWLWRRWRSPEGDWRVLGLESMVIAAGAVSCVDMNLRTPGLIWGLALCFAAIEQKAPNEIRVQGQGSSAWVAGVVGVAVLCMAGVEAEHCFRTDRQSGAASGAEANLTVCLQPLDVRSAAAGKDFGALQWPWMDWAGRGDPVWWWSRAVDAGKGGDRRNQEAYARIGLALRPFHAPYWFWLGTLLDQLGRGDEASACMERALSLEPNFGKALAWQADKALDKGDTQTARILVKRVLAIQKLRMADGSQDSYTQYIKIVDPRWYDLDPRKKALSTTF